MKFKRTIGFFAICVMMISSICMAACGSAAPFAQRFAGVVGSFDKAGLSAVLLFSDSEQAEGRINLIDAPQLNITFRYTISETGDITFDFDTDDTASGTLHGKEIKVTAHVNGRTVEFSGTFYLLTERADGEVVEEGYVTAGHPFADVMPLPEDTKTITVNGQETSMEEFMNFVMPGRDTTVEIVTETE